MLFALTFRDLEAGILFTKKPHHLSHIPPKIGKNCFWITLTVKRTIFSYARDYYNSSPCLCWTVNITGVYDKFCRHFRWSYGVVIWEMVTLEEQPYHGLSNPEVLKYVASGGKLERPDGCPEFLFTLMSQCHKGKPAERYIYGNYFRPDFTHFWRKILNWQPPRFLCLQCSHSFIRIHIKNQKDRMENKDFMADSRFPIYALRFFVLFFPANNFVDSLSRKLVGFQRRAIYHRDQRAPKMRTKNPLPWFVCGLWGQSYRFA